MNILLLSGSMNEPSNSETLGGAFLEGCAGAGATITNVRLREMPLEHFSLKFYEANADQGEHFRRLQEQIRQADGIVIATPVWNFGVPAQVKNLLDRMGSFALDSERVRGTLGGKPFYLILTGGSSLNAWRGLTRKTTSFLPTAIRFFGGTIIGTHYEPKCTAGKGVFRLVVDQRPESLASLRSQGATFANVVKRFTETGQLPLQEAFLKHFFRIGQDIYARFFLRGSGGKH